MKKELLKRINVLKDELAYWNNPTTKKKIELGVKIGEIEGPAEEYIDKKIQNIKSEIVELEKDFKKIEIEELAGLKENFAFKCAFNNSNFNGRCSQQLCEHNWRNGGPWCKNKENKACRSGEHFPCMESKIWKDFSFGAGSYHKGDKKGEKKSIINAKIGKLGFLTTVEPVRNKNNEFQKGNEKDRYIFGILDIIKLGKNEDALEKGKDNLIFGNKETSVKINSMVKVKFWDFHENENAKTEDNKKDKWGSGRFRKLSDYEALELLNTIRNRYLEEGLNANKIDNLIKMLRRD